MSILNKASKKFAVIVGINYIGTDNELGGCINDAKSMKSFLMEKCNYTEDNILLMVDDGINRSPTKVNIINSFILLVNKAVSEGYTELWFSYSGHGSYVRDISGDENDARDEVICPLDFSTSGMIVDDYIYTNLVSKLPYYTTLFTLFDSCNSGTILDLPYLYTTQSTVNNNNKPLANVISISGSRDDQTSADAFINSTYTGAMTWSFLNALANANYNISLVKLVDNMRILLAKDYTQVPLLAVSNTESYVKTLLEASAIPPPPPPTVPTFKDIKFTLVADYWYKESSWNVVSLADNKNIFPLDNKFTAKNQVVTVTKSLATGTYKLVVKDTYGDGGVTSLVQSGLVTLVSAKMTSGRLAEYTFAV